MPVFFIHSNQIRDNILYLTDPLARHIGGALRYHAADQIFVVDEKRTGYLVRLLELKPGQITGQILEEKRQAPASPLMITLGQAILKAKKMDWVLQKATELGVSRLIPLVTERTIVEPKPERLETQLHRWGEILKEAAQQCGRWEIPELDHPIELLHLVKKGASFDLAFIPWEGESKESLKQALRRYPKSKTGPLKVLILIGPEGGFSPQEVAEAMKNGIQPVSLGWRILRADTASIATLTMLQYELGDMDITKK